MSSHPLSRSSAPIVGRDAELRELSWGWDRACSGTPWTVLVEGAPGIGKTALVRHWLATIPAARLLSASGDELESRLAYGVMDQLCRGEEAASISPGGDPLEVGAALVRLLGDLQAQAPVILVVDDAHWADVVSLQALTFAARRLHADRVLTVVVARPDATSIPEGLRRLAESERGTTISLAGLAAGEIVDLAAAVGAGTLPRRGAERLRAHTGGNPLHTVALLSELPLSALSRPSGELPAPRSFKTLMLARLAGTSASVQRLVRATAVLGQRATLGVAGRLAGVEDAPAVLGEALDAGLLVSADGRTVAFPHPLVRAAVYHDMPPAHRSQLHSCAAALVDEPAAIDHRIAAALTEDPELAEELVARAHAAAGAPATAAGYLLAAARLAVDHDLRARHLLDAATLLLASGDTAGAGALAEELEDLPDSARRRAVFGQLAMLAGRDEEAERLLAGAWQLADLEHDADVAALAGATLSQVLLNQARGEEAVSWAERARAVSGADLGSRSVALSTLAGALAATGRADEAMAMVAEQPRGDADLSAEQIEATLARGTVELWTDQLEAARRDLSALVEDTGAWRPMRVRLISLGYLAEVEFRLGLWDASLAHGALAQSLADDADFVWLATHVRVGSAQVLAGRGQWDNAEVVCRGAWEAAQALGSAASIAYGASLVAWLAAVRGDHAAVVEAIQPILALDRRDGVDEPGFMPWREIYAEALVVLDHLEEAESTLAAFEAVAAQRRHRSALAQAARVRGQLEAAKGDEVAARAAFEAARAHAAAVASPLLHAQVDEAHGRFLRRLGERSAAANRLRSAREAFAELGAAPLQERCDRELAACGLSPSRRDPQTRRSLTPQEMAVARLVASGMTNRGVATELVISVKTVEYHLGNVYAKLGVASRTQLAASFASG